MLAIGGCAAHGNAPESVTWGGTVEGFTGSGFGAVTGATVCLVHGAGSACVDADPSGDWSLEAAGSQVAFRTSATGYIDSGRS